MFKEMRWLPSAIQAKITTFLEMLHDFGTGCCRASPNSATTFKGYLNPKAICCKECSSCPELHYQPTICIPIFLIHSSSVAFGVATLLFNFQTVCVIIE